MWCDAAWILLVMFGAAVVMQGMRIKSYSSHAMSFT